MGEINQVSFSLKRAIKMADFKYYNMEVGAVSDVSGSETAEVALNSLKDFVRKEPQLVIDEEKMFYKSHLRIAELRNMISKYKEGTTERTIAEVELKKLEAGTLS